MAEKEMTFKVLRTNADGTVVAAPVEMGNDNPYAIQPMGTMGGGGFRARVNGREVVFASERDFREAEAGFSELGGGSVPEIGGRGMMGTGMGNGMGNGMGMGNRGMRGAGFLRTGADAAEAITGFFQGRNLRQKRDELLSAIDAAAAARDQIAALSSQYPDLVKALLNMATAERDINAAALSILDDQITAMDMTAGIGVVRVMSDLWDGMGGWGGSGGDGTGAFSALAVGGIGLGIGLLLSNSNRGRRGSRGGRG